MLNVSIVREAVVQWYFLYAATLFLTYLFKLKDLEALSSVSLFAHSSSYMSRLENNVSVIS